MSGYKVGPMATNSHSWQRSEGKLKKPKQPQWDPSCNTRSGTWPTGDRRRRRRVGAGTATGTGGCLNVQQDLIFIASIFEFYCVRNARYNRLAIKNDWSRVHVACQMVDGPNEAHGCQRRRGSRGASETFGTGVDKAAATWTFLGHVGVIFHAIK